MTKLRRVNWWSWGVPWLTAVMLLLLPIMTDYLKNQTEVSVQDLTLPVIFNLLSATILTAIFWRPIKRDRLAGYSALVLASMVVSFSYGNRLAGITSFLNAVIPLPSFGNAQNLVNNLVFIILTIVGAYWLGRGISWIVRQRNWRPTDFATAILLAITVTFFIQFLPTVKTVATAWSQYFYKPPALALAGASTHNSNKPDIYYIVLDRYANQNVLKNQFDFDNSNFADFLTGNGYYINADSHNNYPYTTMSIASTLNAGYLTDVIPKYEHSSAQTIVPYHQSIKYAGVTRELKNLGYTFDQIGSWYEATDQAPLADHFYIKDGQLTLFGHTWALENFTKNELLQTPWWPFIQSGVKLGHFHLASYESQSQADMTLYGLHTLNDLAGQSSGGRFIFAHLLIPHDPYYFNADGSLALNPDSNNVGQPIKQKYLGQVQYINGQMKSLLTKINQTSSGQAAVILQADEGPYPIQLNDENFDQTSVSEEINSLDMNTWSDKDLAMKYGNLAAYHIPGATYSDLQAGGDNLNIFRLVFNTYFGTQMPYLPECYYAYPNGRHQPFVYSDITQRLTSQTTSCQTNGTGPK